MKNEPNQNYVDDLLQLLSEAELNLWMVSGSGMGAAFLTIICIAVVRSPAFSKARITDFVRAWRETGSQKSLSKPTDKANGQ